MQQDNNDKTSILLSTFNFSRWCKTDRHKRRSSIIYNRLLTLLMSLLRSITRQPFISVVIVAFLYALLSGLIIQKIIIPYAFNDISSDGLIVPDSISFHGLALFKYNELTRSGLKAWELRPNGASPAGIASFIYYIFGPYPVVLLPFNALLNALSAGILYRLLHYYFPKDISIIGSLLFTINPISLQWTSQLHRDGLFILGTLIMLSSFVDLLHNFNSYEALSLRRVVIFNTIGQSCIWISRPYWLKMIVIYSLVTILFIIWNSSKYRSVIPFGRGLHYQYHRKRTVNYLIPLIISILVSFALNNNLISSDDFSIYPSFMLRTSLNSSISSHKWTRNAFVPDEIERYLSQLSQKREDAIVQGGSSLIDKDVHLNSTNKIISYLPRALWIGLVSPMPTLWSSPGSTFVTTYFRHAMIIPSILSYLLLLFLSYHIINISRKPPLMLLVILCLFSIIIFSIVMPNIGTLLRYRFSFHSILLSLGLCSFLELLSASHTKK